MQFQVLSALHQLIGIEDHHVLVPKTVRRQATVKRMFASRDKADVTVS